jgi:hypothetical protein
MILLAVFQCLYGLSWAILFGAVVLMCFRPNPSEATLEAILVTIMGAFLYIAVYVVLRGLIRLCGYGLPDVPVPQDAVRIRRVIIEEVLPDGGGPPEHRMIREEIAPYDERTDHAR